MEEFYQSLDLYQIDIQELDVNDKIDYCFTDDPRVGDYELRFRFRVKENTPEKTVATFSSFVYECPDISIFSEDQEIVLDHVNHVLKFSKEFYGGSRDILWFFGIKDYSVKSKETTHEPLISDLDHISVFIGNECVYQNGREGRRRGYLGIQ